jgi:hypothetical protein
MAALVLGAQEPEDNYGAQRPFCARYPEDFKGANSKIQE